MAFPEARPEDLRKEEQVQAKLLSACALQDPQAAKAVVLETFKEIGIAKKDWDKAWDSIDAHVHAIDGKNKMDFQGFVQNKLGITGEELGTAVASGCEIGMRRGRSMRPDRPPAVPVQHPAATTAYYGAHVPEEPDYPDHDKVSHKNVTDRARRVAGALISAGGIKAEHQAAVDAYNYQGVNSPSILRPSQGQAPQGPAPQGGSKYVWDPRAQRVVPAGMGYSAPPPAQSGGMTSGALLTDEAAVRNSRRVTDNAYHQANQGLNLNNRADISEYAHKNRARRYRQANINDFFGNIRKGKKRILPLVN